METFTNEIHTVYYEDITHLSVSGFADFLEKQRACKVVFEQEKDEEEEQPYFYAFYKDYPIDAAFAEMKNHPAVAQTLQILEKYIELLEAGAQEDLDFVQQVNQEMEKIIPFVLETVGSAAKELVHIPKEQMPQVEAMTTEYLHKIKALANTAQVEQAK